MKIHTTNLKDCIIIEPPVYKDSRGIFFESFNKETFYKQTGLDIEFVQDNQSESTYGVLRGLHYQTGKMAQAKLVRAIQGKVLDVVVDMRKNSDTFGQHISVILDSIDRKQLFVPRGFAHGFITLSDRSVFSYKCDNYYDKASEAGIIYNDATLSIDWHLPKEDFIISEKDLQLPTFREATR